MVDTGLKINGMGFSADSIWRIVYTRADIVDAINNGWNKELLLVFFCKFNTVPLAVCL